MAEGTEIKVQGPASTWTAVWDGKTTKCRGKTCGATIGFAKTSLGKFVPIDIPEVETDEAGVDVYEPHHSTCVDVKDFR